MSTNKSKWDEALEAAKNEPPINDGFIATVYAELLPQAVALKGVGIVPFDPAEPAHTGLPVRKAAKITCATTTNKFSRTLFLNSIEFGMFLASVHQLGITMDDVEAGVLARVRNEPVLRNGDPVMYRAKDGTEKPKTAWVITELLDEEIPDSAEMLGEPSPNTPKPYYPPPQNQYEHAAKRLLELAYAALPAEVTADPATFVAALGSKRRKEGIKEVPDERLIELAALVIESMRGGDDELPF